MGREVNSIPSSDALGIPAPERGRVNTGAEKKVEPAEPALPTTKLPDKKGKEKDEPSYGKDGRPNQPEKKGDNLDLQA